MTPIVKKILALADAKPPASVEEIADDLQISQGYVYGILREYRPKRKRKKHRPWSPHRAAIVRLAGRGKSARQIADELEITPACVYKWMPKPVPPCPVPAPKRF